MLSETFFEQKKEHLIKNMKMLGAIKSKSVENAFLQVKRENFFSFQKELAYVDNAFSIGFNQTISQPSTVGIMLELLEVKPAMRVLEIGSGCGYVLALLSKLVGGKGKVFGIELVPELFEVSKENLKIEKIENVFPKFGNGKKGLIEEKPFDRILISAAVNDFPLTLIEQLAFDGRMVAPIGSSKMQQIQTLIKNRKGILSRETANGSYLFVPLR